MKQIYILVFILSLTLVKVNAQNTEDFEDETPGSTEFTNNGQTFTISSDSFDTYDISAGGDGGWNGTAVDIQYIANASADNNDGTSFTISTKDETDIYIKSLYVQLYSYETPGIPANSELTIEGKKDGQTVYSIIKRAGFSDSAFLDPYNGFTFIDFSKEGPSDYSNTEVDELVFTTTGDGDYVALDAFTWDSPTFSTNNIEVNRTFRLFPNPGTKLIEVSGLSKTENYRIYNVYGKEVKKGIISNNEKIDVRNLTNGFYCLKFENNYVKFIKN